MKGVESTYSPSQGLAIEGCSLYAHFNKRGDDDGEVSQAALNGTEIHRLIAEALNGIDIDYAIADPYHIAQAKWAAQKTREKVGDSEIFAEEPVDFSKSVGFPNCNGTVDAFSIVRNEEKGTYEVHVFDHKSGKANLVKDFHQTGTYILAVNERFLPKYRITRWFAHINYTADRVQVSKEFTADHLNDHAKRVREAIIRSKTVTVATPNEVSCHFCRANKTCRPFIDWSSRLIDDITELDSEVTPQKCAELLPKLAIVRKAADRIEERTEDLLIQGVPVPGFKRVEGRRPPRRWFDEERTVIALKKMRLKDDILYQKKVISPTTAEKYFREGVIGERQWNSIQSLVEVRDPTVVVVASNDPRPEIKPDPDKYEFDVIEAA